MSKPLALLAAAAALGSGCSMFPCIPQMGLGACGPPLGCQNDADCGPGMVCFVDGCGDPGQNLAVEIVPKDGIGGAQDFPIPPDSLKPVDDVRICPTARVYGGVVRSNDGGTTDPYLDRVAISMRGDSALIPGVHRRYGPTTTTAFGGYVLPSGTGRFVLTALPADLTIPPLSFEVEVWPGGAPNVDLRLPAPEELVQLSGTVLETLATGAVGTSMDIQALDPFERPLSQRVPLALTGEFTLSALRPASDSLVLRVSSTASGAFVPEKRFGVSASSPDLADPLELGLYGPAVSVTGTIVGPDQAPVEGAIVYAEGLVGGGGRFRSAAATTGTDGAFELQTLASMPEVPMQLMVVPPAKTPGGAPVKAGLLVADVDVPAGGGSLGVLACPPRVRVTGQLLRPAPDDGTGAAGVPVTAEPQRPVDGRPLPDVVFETKTDDGGAFELYVDPATYRLDFTPSENLPRASRFASVLAEPDPSGTGYEPLSLPAISLSNGRTLQGTVKVLSECPEKPTDTGVPVPYSSVRFFRLISIEGTPGSVLLAQGVADAYGNFSVVLPTR